MMNKTDQILASIDQKLNRIAKALEEMNSESFSIIANGGVYGVPNYTHTKKDWLVVGLEPENEETKSEQD